MADQTFEKKRLLNLKPHTYTKLYKMKYGEKKKFKKLTALQ